MVPQHILAISMTIYDCFQGDMHTTSMCLYTVSCPRMLDISGNRFIAAFIGSISTKGSIIKQVFTTSSGKKIEITV